MARPLRGLFRSPFLQILQPCPPPQPQHFPPKSLFHRMFRATRTASISCRKFSPKTLILKKHRRGGGYPVKQLPVPSRQLPAKPQRQKTVPSGQFPVRPTRSPHRKSLLLKILPIIHSGSIFCRKFPPKALILNKHRRGRGYLKSVISCQSPKGSCPEVMRKRRIDG